MISKRAIWQLVLLALVCLWGAGCGSGTSPRMDEQRDPFFLAGRDKVTRMDYNGAVESFEKALEVNPRSASAHYELGLIYDQKLGKPATAIHHYERYLQLQPKAEDTVKVRELIEGCKLELVKTLPMQLPTPADQGKLEKLVAENNALRQQVDLLSRRLALLTNQLATPVVNPPAANLPAPASLVSAARPIQSFSVSAPVTNRSVPVVRPTPPLKAAVTPSARPAAVARTHLVKRGETASDIARRYNIKVSSLLAANPSLDPRKMRAGQTLTVPKP